MTVHGVFGTFQPIVIYSFIPAEQRAFSKERSRKAFLVATDRQPRACPTVGPRVGIPRYPDCFRPTERDSCGVHGLVITVI